MSQCLAALLGDQSGTVKHIANDEIEEHQKDLPQNNTKDSGSLLSSLFFSDFAQQRQQSIHHRAVAVGIQVHSLNGVLRFQISGSIAQVLVQVEEFRPVFPANACTPSLASRMRSLVRQRKHSIRPGSSATVGFTG